MSTTGRPFRPGASGNPNGRPKGSRDHRTVAMEILLDGEGEAIVRKAVELAKDGDPTAMRLVLDRLMPPRRERRITVDLPPIETPADAARASAAVVARVAAGELTLSEGAELTKLIGNVAATIATTDLADRVARLEEAAK